MEALYIVYCFVSGFCVGVYAGTALFAEGRYVAGTAAVLGIVGGNALLGALLF